MATYVLNFDPTTNKTEEHVVVKDSIHTRKRSRMRVNAGVHWFVMWYDSPESTYHSSSDFGVVSFIEFALCLIMKADSFLTLSDP